jgi:hypothetical protein
MGAFCPQKGVEHALDYMCHSFNFVASGIGEWLYDGWGHSYPAGRCHRRGTDPGHPGTKTIVANWTLAGEDEVFGEEVVNRYRKIFPNLLISSVEKVSQSTISQSNLQGGITAMKKRNYVIHCLVLLMLIATFTACASTRTHESTGEYVDDSVITTKVKTLLANDDFFKSFQISVETYKGIVQLSGFVNSQNAVDKAGQIARSVKGVASVKNNLIVK